MTAAPPVSWRNIIFRAPAKPMSRRSAAILCGVVVAVLLGADALLLSNPTILGWAAELQVRKALGDQLSFTDLKMSIGGRVKMENVSLRLTERQRTFLSSERATVWIGRRSGSWVAETIQLDRPRLHFNDLHLRELLETGGGGRPLREIIPSHVLPRVTCKGGTLELIHTSIMAPDAPQAFLIDEMVMVPTTGYRYFVRGSLKSELLGAWRIQGEVDLDSGEHRVYLTSEQVELGPKIRDALAASIHPVWDKYRPEGPAGVEMLIAYDRSKADKGLSFRVTLRPRGLRLLYRNFPYPCEQIHGEIEFRADGFTVKNLEARSGPATKIRFDGSADGYEEEAGFHWRIEMDDVPMDEKLRSALGPKARDVWATFRPSGTLDARATAHRERGPNLKESIPVDLTLRGASFAYAGFPYEIDRAEGEIRASGNDIVVKHLKGIHGRGEFRFAGRIDSIDADPVIDLDVRASSLELDGKFRDALSPELRRLWERIAPSGGVNLGLRILRAKGQEPKFQATVQALGNRVQYRDIPLPVLVREGTVEFNEGHVRLNHLKGQLDPSGEVVVSGEIVPSPRGEMTHLEIDGKGVSIDDRFKDRMPKELSEILKTLKLSGASDFKFTLDEWREGERSEMRVALQLDLRKGVIAADVRVEDIDGTIILVGPIKNGKPTLSGTIAIHSARILKKLVRNVSTNFDILGTMLNFRDIAADAYGGKISGWFSLDTVTNDIEGDFTVSRLDLKDFVNDTAKWSGKTIAGKVDLRIPKLKGQANDLSTLKSGEEGCTLWITEGQLLDVPGIVGFLDPLGADRRFTAMKAFFDIRDRKFKIKEFAFLGREGSGSVIGRGDFHFDGHYKLTVRTETASLFGLNFFLARLPGALFDLLKSPLKPNFEGTLEEAFETK
jgi:ribosome-associated translation inhibitor RaiA